MVVYVCLGNDGGNDDYVGELKECCRFVIEHGATPIAPYLIFSQFRNNTSENCTRVENAMGMELLEICNEVWVFNSGNSSFKQNDIKMAIQLGKPIRNCSLLRYSDIPVRNFAYM